MPNDHWYSDEENFWSARSIFRSGYGLDVLPDRGGFKPQRKTRSRLEFVKTTIESPEFEKWLDEQTLSSDDTYAYERDGMHFRATNNGSYGYTYLWAWDNTKEVP
jgi:hypothetical protein